MSEPALKYYTVADLKQWLFCNAPQEGLSEQIIAPTRAWAIIHNPYVRDEDAIVAAIFEDGELAAYTASFPDMLDGKRVWWASTLYCYPKFIGKGYGMIVVGSLKEVHEPDLTYDRWGAQETVEIFNFLGYQTSYTTRYHLSDKKIDTSSFKGKLSYGVQLLHKSLHPWPKLSKADYTLRYMSYIDGEAYAFMQNNKRTDLWLREQDMLNWILRYPFGQGCTMLDKVEKDTEFSANISTFEYQVIKVYVKNQLVGVYVLKQAGGILSVVYMYYIMENRDIVFTSVMDHVISIKSNAFVTEIKELFTFVQEKVYFPKMMEEKVSFSLPINQQSLINFTLQLGDGDSFM